MIKKSFKNAVNRVSQIKKKLFGFNEIQHEIKETKKKINEVNVKSKEYLVLLGSLASLENTLRTFYNTGNVAQLINKGIK